MAGERRPRLGVTFPQTEIGADVGGVRAYAEAAQGLGYQHLLAYDHVLGADPLVQAGRDPSVVGADDRLRVEAAAPIGELPTNFAEAVLAHPGWSGPYTAETLFHEPFVLFGFLAAATPGLELVPGVIILPQRQTALVAKQAAEVDVLTGGRFRLGVGIGWNYVEYEGLGMSFKDRARRFEEQIALLRRLFQEPVLSFEGRFHRVTGAGIKPLPIQRPIPIWIGGSAEPALKRAAELGDGFFPQRPLEGGWPATLEKMRRWREAAGRSWDGFGIEARINAGTGTPDDWRTAAEEWRALGATHLSVNTMNGGLRGPDAHIQRIREVKEALGSLG